MRIILKLIWKSNIDKQILRNNYKICNILNKDAK